MNKVTNMGNGTVTKPINELVNEEIQKLWDDSLTKNVEGCRDLVSLHPLAVGTLNTGAILFIGLNPSFSERAWKDQDAQDAIKNPLEFYAYDRKDYCLEKDLEFEKTARESYSYFEQFKKIAGCSKSKWEHIDLFFVRCTSQKELKAKLSKSLKSFVDMQLEQSRKLIIASDPLVIIVANAEASNRYRKLFEKELIASRFDDRGYHYTCINQKCIPTFFTSMLTGQRALDNGSRERLSWQISQALKDKKLPC